MITIIPAILAKTEEEYSKYVEKVRGIKTLESNWVHIDFMDNLFVQNQSIGLDVVKKYPIELKKEAHLMVMRPLDWLDELLELGFERIIVHAEAEDVEKCIEYIKGRGREVGLALKLETDLEKVKPFLERIDVLLIMTIEIGFQGQPMKPEAIEKINYAVSVRSSNSSALLSVDSYHYVVGVDGHINDEDVKQIVEAGAENLVIGSYFMESDNIDERVEKIKEKLKS